MSETKKIDVEKTIQNILDKRSIGISVDEAKLRAEIQNLKDPTDFLTQCVKLVRTEIAYVQK